MADEDQGAGTNTATDKDADVAKKGPAPKLTDADKAWIRNEIELSRQGHSGEACAELNP